MSSDSNNNNNDANKNSNNINKNNPKLNDKEYVKNNWTKNNIMTLLSWIAISTFNIDCLELAIIRYRDWMRQHVILGLVLSTSAGTLSVTQFGSIVTQNVNFLLNFFFTIFSFTVAISTGCIKVYQVQERLEKFITVKQEWIVFITKIAAQFQLVVDLRKDALELIKSNNDKYLDLLKIDNEIPDFIKRQVKDKFKDKKDKLYFKDFHPSLEIGEAMSISDIIMNIGYFEGKNLSLHEKKNKEKREEPIIHNNKEESYIENDLEYALDGQDYYQSNFRKCISRQPSIEYNNYKNNEINEKDNNSIPDNKLNKIINSLPSFFYPNVESEET